MAELSAAEVNAIIGNPIGDGLSGPCSAFKALCPTAKRDAAITVDQLLNKDSDTDARSLALNLIAALQTQKAALTLHSRISTGPLSGDIALLYSHISSTQIPLVRATTLISLVISDAADEAIWAAVFALVAWTKEVPPSTPPLSAPSFATSYQQTPYSFNTGSFMKTSEKRTFFDNALRRELDGSLHIRQTGFVKAFFDDIKICGKIASLEELSVAVLKKCGEEWLDWPKGSAEGDVLSWLCKKVELFKHIASEAECILPTNRSLRAAPKQHVDGSVAKRSVDVGFMRDGTAEPSETTEPDRAHWSRILVPGELKSSVDADVSSKSWTDLTRYVRELFRAQDGRRYVLGFTLCGSTMRLWEYDRAGATSSVPFDILQDRLQFIKAMLGFLCMSETEAGLDPSIYESEGQRYIQITRKGKVEKLIIDKPIRTHACVAGRGTTCWKVHRDGDKSKKALIVKDSWQWENRKEEGELLREATEAGTSNVARYYHHEDVVIAESRDDTSLIRRGLHGEVSMDGFANVLASFPPRGRSSSSTLSRKRSASSIGAPLPKSKLSRSNTSPDKGSSPQNRVHRRVVIDDCGEGIHRATSRVALLKGLEDAITGHENLLDAGILHRDISIGNIMLDEKTGTGSLVDLDLAIKLDREEASGAPGMTGTKVFMAIGALLDEPHSFMHDLESFFWVLCWICIHQVVPGGKSRVVTKFDRWNYADVEDLAQLKSGAVINDADFKRHMTDHFTSCYQGLVTVVEELRKTIFPDGQRWRKEDRGLYARLKAVLEKARLDPIVLGS